MPGLPVFAKNGDFRTVRVKIREKTAGKSREIPFWIGKKSLVTWLKNRLQTIQLAFLWGMVTENMGRKSSPVYPETRPAVLIPGRGKDIAGPAAVFHALPFVRRGCFAQARRFSGGGWQGICSAIRLQNRLPENGLAGKKACFLRFFWVFRFFCRFLSV